MSSEARPAGRASASPDASAEPAPVAPRAAAAEHRRERVRSRASLAQYAVALVHRLASGTLSRLPRRFTIAAARGVGRVTARLLPARLAVARENVRACLGSELDEAARERIARASFGTAAAMACDLLTLPRVARDPLRHARATPESMAAIARARERGRGTILLAGHFGLFETMGILLGHLGVRPTFVAKPLDNPALDATVNRHRTATGNAFAHKGGAGRRLQQALKGNGVVAIVVDQHVTPRDRLWVPFFGVPAATTRTLGVLARRTGAAIVPIHAYPEARGRTRCEFGPVLVAEETDDPAADAEDLVRRAIAAMEEATRRQPEAWLWLHRRFKVRPDDSDPRRHPAYAITESEELARITARLGPERAARLTRGAARKRD